MFKKRFDANLSKCCIENLEKRYVNIKIQIFLWKSSPGAILDRKEYQSERKDFFGLDKAGICVLCIAWI